MVAIGAGVDERTESFLLLDEPTAGLSASYLEVHF